MAEGPRRVQRGDVLAFRLRRQGLPGGTTFADARVLDLGVPDSGADGGTWALANRGIRVDGFDDLVLAWTLRGAPHFYRRADVAAVATASAPLSETDARARIHDASKPLVAAGIDVLDALTVVADAMRDIVVEPTPKGEVSRALTARLPDPYLRSCRPCDTTHVYEQPFRLAALQAGLELVPGTSPPVLRRIDGLAPPRYRRLATAADPRHDIVRTHLRLSGPVRQADTARCADVPRREMAAHWPHDTIEVAIDDDEAPPRAAPRHLLGDDVDELLAAGGATGSGTRLLGPFDPYLQLQDRGLLVPDETHRRDLWRILGRPGAVLHDGELVGTWRPRAKANAMRVAVTAWATLTASDRAAIGVQAEHLAAHRGVGLAGVDWD